MISLLSWQNIPGKEKYTQSRHMKQYGIMCKTKIRFNILILEFNFSLHYQIMEIKKYLIIDLSSCILV